MFSIEPDILNRVSIFEKILGDRSILMKWYSFIPSFISKYIKL